MLVLAVSLFLLLLFTIFWRYPLRASVPVIILFGFSVRVLLSFIFQHVTNYDTQSYEIIGSRTLALLDIYKGFGYNHHPYLPMFLYVEAFASWFVHLGIPQMLTIKLLLSFVDTLIIVLVYHLSRKNLKTALLYAVNPVTILIVTVQGQFDVIPIAFLLFATYCLEKKKEIHSLLFLSMAIAFKTWPVLVLFHFIHRIQNKKLLWIIPVVPLASILFYSLLFRVSVPDVLYPVLSYRGAYGVWGTGFILAKLGVHSSLFFKILSNLVTLGCMLTFLFWKKAPLTESLFRSLLLFFVITPTFGIQWLAWLTPFILLTKSRYRFLLIFVFTVYISRSYMTWF